MEPLEKQIENLQIERVPLESITPYWRNPRRNAKAIAAVTASITAYGFRVPIVLDKERVIIMGHTRYKCAIEMGLKVVPVIIAEDLPPEKVRELRIADNRTSELAEWDPDPLQSELREMQDTTAFLEVYFKDDPIADFIRNAAENEGQFMHGVTDESIKTAEDNLKKVMGSRVKDAQDDMLEMICPHCQEKYFVSYTNVLAIKKAVDYKQTPKCEDPPAVTKPKKKAPVKKRK
jgi:hypothetical protein